MATSNDTSMTQNQRVDAIHERLHKAIALADLMGHAEPTRIADTTLPDASWLLQELLQQAVALNIKPVAVAA
jgi:hypothetical protein